MDSLPISTTARPQRLWLIVQFVTGLLIGGLGLAWAIHGLNWGLVLRGLASAQYGWVLISLGCVVAVALTKAARWGALYAVSERHNSFWDLFSALMITQMVNVLIPIRVGELVRIGLMKQSGQPGAATLSTIVVEKSLDLAAVGLMAVSLAVLAVAPTWLQDSAGSIMLVGLTLVIGLALVWRLREWMERMLTRILAYRSWLPEAGQKRLLRVIHTMLQAYGALTDWSSMARILIWTAVTWTFSLLTILCLFAAFGLKVPTTAAVVLMLALTFTNIVPSPPALIGLMQGVAVIVLNEYGIASPVGLGVGVVLNIVTVGPLIVLGSVTLAQRALFSVHQIRLRSWRGFWSHP